MNTLVPDEELAALAVQAGLAANGAALSPEQRAFANLIAHRCADIADRRDPAVRPGEAIRDAFGLKERRKTGRRSPPTGKA